ncbi:MAG: hypothetical protein WC346_03840 [Methanogenium sp.]
MFVDASIMGNLSLIHKFSNEVSILNYFEKCLESSIYFERDDNYINDIIYKIREFINIEGIQSVIDYFTTKYPNFSCTIIDSIPGTIINPEHDTSINITNVYNTINNEVDFEHIPLSVSVIGQTEIELPFDVDNVDVSTIFLEVQGDDPTYTATGNGYHIEGTTLIWHNEYRLRPGMQITIKWRSK